MFTRSQAAVQRGNPVECIGCQHPCQQVNLHSPAFGNDETSVDSWFQFLTSSTVGIAGLRHIVVNPDARVCHLHFATPASAFFFFHSPHRRAPLRAVLGNMTIVQSTSVNHHWTRYHQGRHYPGQPCHHNYDVPIPPPSVPYYHRHHRHRRRRGGH
ncbi:hypothetical protein DM01DRAFT_1401671 [Hesseltinella vesiculosa]|uniref:Uncharacterized protein n=1 Tax=Hesseltinella vesiculosa TaxID=101127 RepID=A0A1X2GMF2_9FUNG|nr:hypothetical protein DM01DRAFT_1402222 [Hesseltinella vesiculosa]ORX57359.1 hypothetical protein DM01DRAFT_1401671 [Hesseltinella vesiculosa]